MEYTLPEEMIKEGSRLWPCAFLPASSCIFFVTFIQKGAAQGFAQKRIACFSDPLEVITFCESRLYTAVRVMSPNHINKTDDWQIDDLVEIWQGEEPDAPDLFVRIYVMQNKVQYCDSHLGTLPAKLINKKLSAKFISKDEAGITNSFFLKVWANYRNGLNDT